MNSTQILGQELNYACVEGSPKGPVEKVSKNQKEICFWITELCVALSVNSLPFFFFLNWVNFPTMHKSGARKLNFTGLKCQRQRSKPAKQLHIKERGIATSKKIKREWLPSLLKSLNNHQITKKQGKLPESQEKKIAMGNLKDRDISCCIS